MKNKLFMFFLSIVVIVIGLNLCIKYKKLSSESTFYRVVYVSPDNWLSDDELVNKYSKDALSGNVNSLTASSILYDRFFWRNHDFEKARPFLEIAAKKGDDNAILILKDPEREWLKMKGK